MLKKLHEDVEEIKSMLSTATAQQKYISNLQMLNLVFLWVAILMMN